MSKYHKLKEQEAMPLPSEKKKVAMPHAPN